MDGCGQELSGRNSLKKPRRLKEETMDRGIVEELQGTRKGCSSSSIAVAIKACYLLESGTVSNARISALFCRLAARLVEHVCLPVASTDPHSRA